jgi:hypothetical protein
MSVIRKIVMSKERKKEEKEEGKAAFILWSGVRRHRALVVSDFSVAGV